jgi:hypothetical protein
MNRGLLVKIGLVAVLISVIIVGYNGCGGGGSSSSGSSRVRTLSVRGTIGTGYFVSAPSNILDRFCSIFTPNKAWASYSDGTVDKVIAIQVEGGYIGSYFIQTAIESLIQNNTFSLSLEKDKDWMLLLVDTNAVDKERFVGYVSLKVDATDNLLMVPATTASSDTFNIGTVEKSGEEAVSINAVTATDFAMTADGLLALAKNDELFKAVKNIFTNYNYTTQVYYNLRPDFKWRGQYASIQNAFQAPADYTFISYQFQLDTNDGLTLGDVAGIDGKTKKSVQLYPPTGMEVPTNGGTITYSDSVPLSNANLGSVTTHTDGTREVWSTTPGEFFAGEGHYGDGGALSLSYSYGSAALTGTIPAGYWTYKIDGVTKGEFDCAVATPLTTDFKIKGFVPVLKVNTEAVTNRITSIDIEWYTLSGTSYTRVTDTSALKYLISSDMYIENSFSGRRYDSFRPDSTMSSATPTMTWYFGTAGSEAERAWSFGIFYSIGGVGHFFEWFR